MSKKNFSIFEVTPQTVVLIIAMTISTGISVAQALVLGDLINRLGGRQDVIYSLLLLLILSITAALAKTFLKDWPALKVQIEKESDSSNRLLHMVLGCSQRCYITHEKGYYINLITNSAGTYGCSWGLMSLFAVGNGLCVIVITIAIALVSPIYLALFAVYIPLYFLCVWLPGKTVSKMQNEALPTQDVYLNEIKRIVDEKRAINVAHAEQSYLNRFNQARSTFLRFICRLRFFQKVTENLPLLLSGILQVSVLAVSAWLLLTGSISLGTVLAAYQISSLLQTPLDDCFANIIYVLTNFAHIRRLRDFADQAAEPSGFEGLYHEQDNLIQLGAGSLYATRTQEASLFSTEGLTIPKGTLTLIKGKNGTGKSMLVDYLTGFSDVDDFDGIASFDNSLLHCAYLTYPILVVSGTLEDNLFSMVKNTSAAAMLGIDELETKEFDDKAVNLSFGEKQKLALLRTFSQGSDVLMLDEPLSNLDRASANRLVDFVAELKGRMSVIAIMHSPELDEAADCILTIEDHRLVRTK